MALLLLATFTLLACGRDNTVARQSATPSVVAAPKIDPWSGYAVGWSRLSAPPEERWGEAWVWVGSELLVAGGCNPDVEDRCSETRATFAFDPAVGSWRSVQSSVSPMVDAEPVSTGSEALFIQTSGEDGPIIGQAYDPVADEWRAIPPAPLDRAHGVLTVWTGDELIIWGGGDRSHPRLQGAVYDPTSDTWRRIADAPFGLNLASGVWTGREMVVFGSLLDGSNHSATPTSVGEAYDPATDRWRELPPSALSPQATSAALVGDQLVAWDYEAQSQEYDPTRDRWSAPLHMPFEGSECYPDSIVVAGLLFAWFCGKAALFDEGTSAWQRINGGPLDDTLYSKAYNSDVQLWRFADPVNAGPVVVMPMEGITLNDKGVACYGCDGSPTSLWVYRPQAST
jgi:hypothetical protein